MIATWMLYGTVIALLAGLGALALERGARLMGRAGRWCWVVAMMVALALPVIAWYRPQVLPPAVVRIPTPSSGVDAAAPVTIRAPQITMPARSSWTWADLNRPLATGWALLTLGMLTWFGLGTWRLARMRRLWRSEEGVLVSENVGPAVIGFLRCQVVVPEWSLEFSSAQRELLFAHEAEHLSAHDSRLLLLTAAVLAAVPWNVGLWWQFRRLRLAIELDCDQRVLRRRPDPATYGRLLIDVGARAARSFVPVAAFHEPTSSLEHRIRALTALRPKWPALWAAGAAVACGVAVFAACEAPRPMGPVGKVEPFSIQINQEDGRLLSTYIRDSVRRYMSTPADSVYEWFVLSPDHHVVRYGTTKRNPDDHVIRSEAVDSVIPGFEYSKTQRVTVVGENAMGPGSPPVYWAELRDPSKPSTWLPPSQADSFLAQRWVHEVLAKHYGELLERPEVGAGLELWILADSSGRAFEHIVEEHVDHPGLGNGDLQRLFPGLPNDAVAAVHSGEVVGFARKGVQLVWVTLATSPAVKEWMHQEGMRAEAEEREGRGAEKREHGEGEGEARERREAEKREQASAPGGADEEARGKLREAVAKYYPQYLTQHANPPVVLWFNEGPDGALQHEQTLRTPGEGVGPVPADMGGGASLFTGWLTIGSIAEHRPDVTLVWVHHGRPPKEDSESH